RALPRPRQDRHSRRDPPQARSPDARGAGRDRGAPRRRKRAARADEDHAAHAARRLPSPRASGRVRLSRGNLGPGHPDDGPHRHRCRHLRRPDDRPRLPGRAARGHGVRDPPRGRFEELVGPRRRRPSQGGGRRGRPLRLPRRPSRARRRLSAGMELVWRDAPARIREMGAGPAVVLLHGYPLDGAMWSGVARALAPRFRVLKPDLPGRGETAAPSTGRLEDYADFAEAVLAALPAGAGVAGFSMGGYVALELARRAPERLRALALVDTR